MQVNILKEKKSENHRKMKTKIEVIENIKMVDIEELVSKFKKDLYKIRTKYYEAIQNLSVEEKQRSIAKEKIIIIKRITIILLNTNRLSSLVVVCSLLERGSRGSNHARVKPKISKFLFAASPLSTPH